MTNIKSVIIDEYNRNKRTQQAYLIEFTKLPRGSICRKHIKGRDYYYWVYREGGRVVNKYISGRDKHLDTLMSQVHRRRMLGKQIKRLQQEQKVLERILRAAGD